MDGILTDRELLLLARSGDAQSEELLIGRYARNVRAVARAFSLAGWDVEDFIQEGMLALVRAIHSYAPDGGASFSSYVDVCVRRQLLNAVARANNNKNILLTDYVSYDAPVPGGDGTLSLGDTLVDERFSAVEDAVIARDHANRLLSELYDLLSNLEKRVLVPYLAGISVSEIADTLMLPAKSVDNAITRIRRKAMSLPHPGDNRP
ncbi:MAG: sigma-70 family RNA polymerase sigma factor [Clostridia bacterium]|nr:sigma-70 family RNA polymerase sigma factor [Clostridia bacterium]